MTIPSKRDALLNILREMESVAVAFSGGGGSGGVAQGAALALGPRAMAITAHSPSVARQERLDAERIARQIGIRHYIIETQEFKNPE